MSEGAHVPERLRADARALVDVALEAVTPDALVRQALEDEGLPGAAPVTVLAVGKAAVGMVRGAHEAVGSRIGGGLVIAPESDAAAAASLPTGLTLRHGGHPLPTEDGSRAAEEAARLLEGLGKGDVLLALVSGGASALMALPMPGLSLDAYRATTELLLRAGAPIRELNAVRKHLDALKGGRAAVLAAPARTLVLVISDVVGNDPAVVASGPFAPDPTRFEDALAVLEERGLLDEVPAAVRQHLEAGLRGDVPDTPGPEDPAFQRVSTHIVGTNSLALHAAARRAATLGYAVRILDAPLEGEARLTGTAFAESVLQHRAGGRPVCILRGGETTVTVTGGGRGGRSQELALAAALRLEGAAGVLVAAVGTDGIDGPTDAAGAMADGGTVARGREAGVDARAALDDNDAYGFFAAEGGLVITGPTGGNVMDVAVGLVREEEG